ncbi:PBP1A family penicillin-binding protein [Chakrabartyella piscis]|uniref:transglycosylase domain-containing protein n=1 Tax=Chakrabartyella piscis TaxID=2918914 RepID=UPI002958CF06|nr:PBP1A family penicillin-binding protein [Chakrabartyella piscis]
MEERQQRRRPREGAYEQEGNASSGRNLSAKGTSKKAPKGKKKKKKKSRARRIIGAFFKFLFALIVILGFAVAGAGLGIVYGILEGTDVLNTSDVLPESYTSLIYDDNGIEIDKLHGEENREYAQLDYISEYIQLAVVSIEDVRFYEHNGIDYKGVARAIVENIKAMDLSQGASTITQQLIKNEVLSNEKTFQRKIKEQYLAISLEQSLEKQLGSKEAAKDYILELYLNTISLSHGLNGVEAASQYYFGKNASDVTLAEAAMIAGITKNPSLYAPDMNAEESRNRQLTVLYSMLTSENITQAEYDAAVEEDVFANLVSGYAIEETGTSTHSYFVEALIAQVATDLVEEKNFTSAQAYNLIYSGGLEIYSTVDMTMQGQLEAAFLNDDLFPESDNTYDVTYLISVMDTESEDSSQSHYERNTTVDSEDDVEAFVESVKAELLDDTHVLVLDNVTVSRSLQAAMVIMDHYTGEIKAIVGGRGEKPGDSVLNRATQSLRQQGSTMKVLASYAPAIDLGLLMPGSIIVDEPYQQGSWKPQNWTLRFDGPSTVREGIYNSMNILAIKAYLMVGAETSYQYLLDFGLTTITEEDKNAATAIGGLHNGVSTLEQTAAYATIANGGVYMEPHYYSVVYDHNGDVLLDNTQPEGTRVLKETTAYLLTDMMEDVITRGTGGKAALSGITVAGKTGTTNDSIDLTFYGYTPYYTAGIWMGYDIPKEITTSSSAHLTIWQTVMNQVHEGLENAALMEKPDGIITQTYCSASGDIPCELCGMDYYGMTTHSDIAAVDSQTLQEVCTVHQTVTICTESGMLVSDTCPENCHMEVVIAMDEGLVNNGGQYDTETRCLSEPSYISDGYIDMDLSQTCDLDHGELETGVPGYSSPLWYIDEDGYIVFMDEDVYSDSTYEDSDVESDSESDPTYYDDAWAYEQLLGFDDEDDSPEDEGSSSGFGIN